MDRPIFFCHIPKTGGTSVRLSLATHFPREQKMPGPGMMEAAGGHYPPISIVAREMRARGDAIRFMYGHYHISTSAFLANPIEMVVLREPISQLISHMRHFIGAGQFTIEHCLKALDDGKCPVQNNIMTRYLSGTIEPLNVGPLDEKHRKLMLGPIDSSRIEEALTRIEKIDIVGFTDRMSEFIKNVEITTEIPVVEHRVNEAKAEPIELSPNRLATLMELNKYDIELYEKARIL